MSGRVASFSTLLLLAGLVACEGGVPSVRSFTTVVPHLAPPSEATARALPSMQSKALNDGKASAERCQQWQTETEIFNRRSGEFEYHYQCLEGGEVASIRTVGLDNGDGTGAYSTTYTMRDGSEVVWEFEYRPDPVIADTTHYVGTGTNGGVFEGEYRDLPLGGTYLREVYRYPDTRIVVEGISEADGRFNGSEVYDDLSTEVSPDWTLVQAEHVDGTLQQSLNSTADGWDTREKTTTWADGSSRYEFRYDDLGTEVAPDFDGDYDFNPSGHGEGGYQQHFVDLSLLTVEQHIDPAGTYLETWIFDDALSSQPVEQEGELRYQQDGHGFGSLTTYVVGGNAETCDLEVFADGTTIIGDCR